MSPVHRHNPSLISLEQLGCQHGHSNLHRRRSAGLSPKAQQSPVGGFQLLLPVVKVAPMAGPWLPQTDC